MKDRIKAFFRSHGSLLPAIKEWWKTPQGVMKLSAFLSLYTLIVFNIPAFKLALDGLEGGAGIMWTIAGVTLAAPLLVCAFSFLKSRIGYIASSIVITFAVVAVLMNCSCNWNGVLILMSVAILLFVLNSFLYYVLLWLGRVVGKVIISVTFIINAVCLYSIHTYNAFITEPTIANVFNTRYSEASGFFSASGVAYALLLGLPPCIYLFAKKIDYSKFRRFLVNILAMLLVAVLVLFSNVRNVLWIDQNATLLGGRLMPWSYIVNTARHFTLKLQGDKVEIILPDAQITTASKDVCVLVIGESARRGNFSLYGYGRDTNPLLAGDSVTAYIAKADDVSTIGGVKAILSYKGGDDLYEILPNYLSRHGVDVVWRTNNWGEPPLHIEKYTDKNGLVARYPNEDGRYDGVLFAGLAEEIQNCDSNKQLIVIHCYTSHGPKYYANYPDEFNVFTPVCTSVEVSSADRQGLLNAYDNTILYTDYLVHSVIETLEQVSGKRCCMIFVSDHGESLGEGDMFMHGTMPKRFAPKEQLEIPFIVWQNDSCTRMKKLNTVDQFHVFHSVMYWLGVNSPIFDESKNVFEPVN